MYLPFGATVYRLRAGLINDEYGAGQVPGDWESPDVLPIPAAFVAHTSTSMLTDASREQALEAKSLYCEGSADVQKGDRIFAGTFDPELPDDADTVPEGTRMLGEIYTIDGIPPAADTNPFTGWTPQREIPLTRAIG